MAASRSLRPRVTSRSSLHRRRPGGSRRINRGFSKYYFSKFRRAATAICVDKIFQKARRAYRHVFHFNNVFRSIKNAQHHYDISYDIYKIFLDSEMQYSCAYFEEKNYTIEQAQRAKIRHISRKLQINKNDLRVLDIGCGWGKMAIHLARDHHANVVGINVSKEQIKIANVSLAEAQRDGPGPLRCEFRLADYRDLPENLPENEKIRPYRFGWNVRACREGLL